MKLKKQHIVSASISFFVLLVSCTQKSIDPNVLLFQQELGEENIAMIDRLVEEFEEHLDKQYPDLKTSEEYTQLLKDVSDLDTTNDSLLLTFQSKKSQERFRASTLCKELYIKQSNKTDSTIASILKPITPPPHPYKEALDKAPDSIYRVNTIGKYMQALYAIKAEDSVIKSYFRFRERFGIITHYQFADGIQYYKPDFDNYIHKRIVAITILENSF